MFTRNLILTENFQHPIPPPPPKISQPPPKKFHPFQKIFTPPKKVSTPHETLLKISQSLPPPV